MLWQLLDSSSENAALASSLHISYITVGLPDGFWNICECVCLISIGVYIPWAKRRRWSWISIFFFTLNATELNSGASFSTEWKLCHLCKFWEAHNVFFLWGSAQRYSFISLGICEVEKVPVFWNYEAAAARQGKNATVWVWRRLKGNACLHPTVFFLLMLTAHKDVRDDTKAFFTPHPSVPLFSYQEITWRW